MSLGLPIQMLNGFSDLYQDSNGVFGVGCPDCGGTCNQLQGVTDYDIIVIGGQEYTANQILDKQLIAKRDTPIYSKGNFTTPVATIRAGNPIGKVYSYLKPSTLTGGKSALMYYTSAGNAYYTLNENNTIDTGFLKDQGTLTVAEETKKAEQDAMRENDPVQYYLKKLAIPVLLIVGGIIVVKTIAPKLIDKALPSKPAPPALSGPAQKRKRKIKK